MCIVSSIGVILPLLMNMIDKKLYILDEVKFVTLSPEVASSVLSKLYACLINTLYSFLKHQASYSNGYFPYLKHREDLGSNC